MRMAIAGLLALVAVAALGMWGLAQFGGAPKVMVAEERVPVAKVDTLAAANASAPLADAPTHQPGAAHPNAPDTLKTDKPATTAAAKPAAAAAAKPAAAPPVTAATPPASQVAEAAPPPPPPPPPPPAAIAAPEIATKPESSKDKAKKMLAEAAKDLVPLSKPSAGLAPDAFNTPTSAKSAEAAPAPAAAAPPAPAPVEKTVTIASVEAPKPAAKAVSPPAPIAQPATAAAASAGSLSDQFKTRKVAYNRPPTTLYLDRPIDISLVIDATAAADPAKELQGFPGTVVERDVELSDTVSAQLTGVGFDITSQSVARQNLSGRVANRWQWRVTPTEPGERVLILDIFGYKAGSLDAEPLDAYRDKIVVQVKQLDSVIKWAKGIQPVFAVLAAIAGALSALLALLRFRRDGKKTS